MRNRSGAVAVALGTAVLLGGASPLPTANLTVVATGLRNSNGVVRACLTTQNDRFPSCSDAASSYSATGPAASEVTLAFPDVKPGRYAVALLHDENGNGKADRAALMIPREGFGFSRDAKVRFGPPSFEAAAFDVAPGASQRIVIHMRYML